MGYLGASRTSRGRGADVSRVTIRTPAKLNLGLEIVGRRSDGYHDVVTILQAVSIYDDLALAPSHDLDISVADPALATEDNLALKALRCLRKQAGVESGATVTITKGIPVAAGLGGASSDAAATLLAARGLWDVVVSDETLADLAARIGSDVPFFLRGGTSLATGRGEHLTALPRPNHAWFVVVSPRVAIPRKTATLYAALRHEDVSNGDRVRAQAERLRSGEPLDPSLLRNTFERPLHALRPEVARVGEAMRHAGAAVAALSGAGPSHYAVAPDAATASTLAQDVRRLLGETAVVVACESVNKPPTPVPA